MSRVKKEKVVFGEDKLALTQAEKRFATPEIVANYRAERLACDTIIDLCSGLGFQSFSFAKTCKRVIAVEKNLDLIAKARNYAQKLYLKNITFLCGDILSQEIINKIRTAAEKIPVGIIFCDPQRTAAEKERSLATIQPNIKELLVVYSKITPNIAIELPPHIFNTTFDAEYEYLSVNDTLNRLTLYFGSLKKAEKSVVLLPQNEKIRGFFQKMTIFASTTFSQLPSSKQYSYILEPNPALVLSGLFYEAFCTTNNSEQLNSFIAHKDIIQFVNERKIYFLSTYLISNLFFISYKILEIVKVGDGNPIEKKEYIKKFLRQHSAAKVILRYPLNSKNYWNERMFFEKGLNGTKTLHLFLFDVAVICEKVAKTI